MKNLPDKHHAIFSERNLDAATRRLAELEQFADTRDGFVNALNQRQLTANERYTIREDDETIAETLAFAQFYVIHLADLEAHRPDFRLAA
jgi:hypothetical protein